MDEFMVAQILRKASLAISLFGIAVGLDLLCGAKVILAVKRVLDKAYNFDKTITQPKARVFLGGIMLFVSVAMLLLLITTK